MRKYFIVVTLLICSKQFLAQENCFHIDSIRVYHIPLNIKTRLSLSSYDVRTFDKSLRKEITIKNDTLIKSFSEINLFEHKFKECPKESCIDERAVFDIFYKEGLVFTIGMDSTGYYSVFDVMYNKNDKLLNWINTFIFKIGRNQ